jgi:hypothetical protein
MDRIMRARRWLRRVGLVALLVTPGAPMADPRDLPPAAAGTPVQAVWVEHEASFTYFGQTAFYSCDGLRDKVRYLLQQVGARTDDLKVRVSCMQPGGGVEVMPHVRVSARLPAEATPELLQQRAHDPRRELVARVRGEGDTAEAVTAQFPAVARIVEFDGRRGSRIEDGDCELLEQMVQRVFTPMGITVADGSRLSCLRHQVSFGSVRLRLATLQKAPDPDAPVPR